MIQILVVGLAVFVCAIYWLQRLAPQTIVPLCRGIAHALPADPLRQRVENPTPPQKPTGSRGPSGFGKNAGSHCPAP